MSGKLEGKTALITGASKGLGRAIAEEFAKEGARVAINYAHDEKSALEVKKITGGEIFKADVSNRDQVKEMARQIHEKLGKIDILVNNSGIWYLMPFENYDEEKVRRMLDVNLMGAIYTTLEFLPDLKEKKGTIINIGSNAGIGTAAKNTTFYSLTKAAIIMLTKRLAFDLSEYSIRVNAIAPGWIETDLTIGGKTDEEIRKLEEDFKSRTTLKMFGKPEYIGKAALFLASSDSVYMNGQVIVIDGGRIDNLTHSI
ncbi:3-oxoacyl-acyl carrier protein reductase [Thermoplasma volcanium GSS1]|uniref:3-oxoacyl-acyl carrier protein reductase n=1 Tax=Thermoplasma volcanium (strain ATCC 51530 / DSM 4299 / JCM 9571 / NBRC 15438 / GSS1) TaxID=273116 RepID=Q978P7_THEVO|nr:SDR family oxidoreductase [Thermoplasma volcanium]BAB60510.1 3-oxoacyl-acyl carrier protein reductase [Thermoplasma volcanium GSS1]